MHVSEFLLDVPSKKGYLLYGDEGVISWVLHNIFPQAREVASPEELASSAPGEVIIPNWWTFEALPYLGLPASDRIYIFTQYGEESNYGEVDKSFSKMKLPRVDCSNPTTPKPQRLTVDYIQQEISVAEPIARRIAVETKWDLCTIFTVLRLWAATTEGITLNDRQARNLVDILVPPQVYESFISSLLHQRYHEIQPETYKSLDSHLVLMSLADKLNSFRIYLEVYSPSKNHSTMVRESGLSATELKEFDGVRTKWTKRKLKQWSGVLVWAHQRHEHPHVLESMVTVLKKG